MRWAAIAESGSEHPLARPILEEAGKLGPVPQAQTFEMHTGRGVTATYEQHLIAVGTPALMAELDIEVSALATAEAQRLKQDGKTAVLVALDGALIGVLGIADSPRADAQAMVAQLKKAGVRRIVMLTGDDELTAQAVAKQTGVTEVYARLLPEQKLEIIRKLQAEGHVVAMAGDGVNDAPALAAADIGIAMGAAGTGVAIETADMALMADDLMKLPEAIKLSKATLRNIRQNTAIAMLTVGLLLAGVLVGEVQMAGGMLVHEASVLVVIGNGMRLLRAGNRE